MLTTEESESVERSDALKTFRAEDFSCTLADVEGWQVSVTRYRLGDQWVCKVDNVDPGAVISRATAATSERAYEAAITKAADRLRRTVRHE